MTNPPQPDRPGRRHWWFAVVCLALAGLHAAALAERDPLASDPWPSRSILYWLVVLFAVTWGGIYARGRWVRYFGRLAVLAVAAGAILSAAYAALLSMRYGHVRLELVRWPAFVEQCIKLWGVLIAISTLDALVRRAGRWALRLDPTKASGADWRRWVIGAARIGVFYAVSLPWIFVFMQVHQQKLDYTRRPDQPAHTDAAAGIDALPDSTWLLPGPPGATTAVVVCHGVGADQADLLIWARMFRGMGCHVVSFDWPGHGRGQGVVTSYGGSEWIDAARVGQWLRDPDAADLRRELLGPVERVVIFGPSMGGQAALQAAGRYPALFDGIIIDSSYRSADEMADHRMGMLPGPVAWPIEHGLGRAWFWWETGRRLSSIDARPPLRRLDAVPKLFVHCEDDRIVPADQGRLLYASAGGRKTWLGFADGNHLGGLLAHPHTYQAAIRKLLSEAGHPDPTSSPMERLRDHGPRSEP